MGIMAKHGYDYHDQLNPPDHGGLDEGQHRNQKLPPAPAPTSNNRSPARRVDHTYRDYSSFPSSKLPPVKKAPTNFPSKLHQILSNPSYAHVISWMPHGRAWKIHNKELLVRDVISKHFVQSKYESFTRQLNGWGFKRLHQSGNDYNAYYHPCFLRGLPHLTVLMNRVKPNQGKQIPHVEGEPNFYEIEKQFPLPLSPALAPMMPYNGHYPSPYSSSLPTNAPGYGAPPGPPGAHPPPPEPPVGYHNHYPPHPGHYSHPPPYSYGHPNDPYAPPSSPYACHSPRSYAPAPHGHPPPNNYHHPYDPAAHAHPRPQHYPTSLYPDPAVPQFPTLPRGDDPPKNIGMAPGMNGEAHLAPRGSVPENRVPDEGTY